MAGCSAGSSDSWISGRGERGGVSTALIRSNPAVVIRQVYGGGGNSGATLTNDFIELFNRSDAPFSLANLSVQYTSAAGTGSFGSAGSITLLPAFTLQPGQSFLVQEAAGTGGTMGLPTPDATGSIAMSATAGKVALVNSTSPLGCNTDTGSDAGTPCSDAQTTLIIDLVGYGNANYFEGAGAAPTLTNTTAALRNGGGCVDTNNNAADFVSGAPAPRNSISAPAPCGDAGTVVPDAGATDAGGSDAGTVTIGQCGDPATPIGAIQGTTEISPKVGQTVVIEGAVVGDFQGDPINGFFVEQPDGTRDNDPNTSEGIFVFQGTSQIAVAVGNRVRVMGTVAEFNSLTELSSVSAVVVCPGTAVATADTLTFPVPSISDLERHEGMLVTIAQPLTVTGNFGLGRFGTLDLAVGDPLAGDAGASNGNRLFQPTHVVAPGPAAVALQSLNDRSRILLDDLSNSQDPNPIPYKDLNNTRRVGDKLTSLTGVLDGSFPSDGTYRIRPTAAPAFVAANPRPATPPNVGGRLRVAAANVLNFFTTLDTSDGGLCGPTNELDCRGANTQAEFDRQRTKILNELQGLNADVAGLMEIENNSSAATQSLVDGLNTRLGPGTYAFINTGTIGTDAIKVALIYKPAKVTPVGAFAILTTAFDARFIDTKNRPALTQTFAEVGTGERFTVVVNHLKSKGSACTDLVPPDPDTGDGQGNCNQTRTAAAQALLHWIATDPTHSGDPDFLLIGDMNAYAKEDPITTFKSGGLKALLEALPEAYSYQFDAQSGYLDHALATQSLAAQVSGVAEWHNNADEPVVLDYNQEFKTDDPFNLNDPFRASDHDPVVVGLNLTTPVPAMGLTGNAALGVLLFASGLFAAGAGARWRRRRWATART